jgi:hypothetical protein
MTGYSDDQAGGEVEVRKRMVVEFGVELDGIWLPLAMLRRLTAHGPWDQPFTEATVDQEQVLLLHSLAERHNHYGLHRGVGLSGFLNAIPFSPTDSFPAVPDDGGYGQPAPGAGAG